jgi:hypothetical protein
MNDHGTPGRSIPDRIMVKKFRALNEIEPNDNMAAALQVLHDRAADPAAVTGDENPHSNMIPSEAPQCEAGLGLGRPFAPEVRRSMN